MFMEYCNENEGEGALKCLILFTWHLLMYYMLFASLLKFKYRHILGIWEMGSLV